MARSVHTNRDDYRRARRGGASPERLEAIKEELARKRQLKAQVREARRAQRGPAPEGAVEPEGVVIRVAEEGEHVLHAASPDDLRAVIARLPEGALNGISEVVLSVGRDVAGKAGPFGAGGDADPITGRVGAELVPDVWSGEVLGRYWTQRARIELFAYVLSGPLPAPEFTRLYLRLLALKTFVHEVAHHADDMQQHRRRHVRRDSTSRSEQVAEAYEHRWTQEVVIPYLEEAYPDDCAALVAWAKRRSGLEVTLEQLAGDPRRHAPGGVVYLTFPLASAFEALVGLSAQSPGDDHAARLEFAEEVHFGDAFELALQVVDGVLAEDPASLAGRTLRADLLEHLERYDEALALAREVLREDPARDDAWRVAGLVHWAREAWTDLLEVGAARLALDPSGWTRESILSDRGRALLELGRFAEVEGAVAALHVSRARATRARAAGLLAMARLGGGDLRGAARAAEEGLAGASGTVWEHRLVAARFEALHGLGEEPEPLEARTLAGLRRAGEDAWAERLERLQPEG